jgi:hypothetical protein
VHTRRISAFLLGAWIAGCLFMTFIMIENLRAPSLVMASPAAPVAKIIQQLGWDQTSALLRHAAAEQIRLITTRWIEAQLPLALALLACLALATQKRVMPLALCGIMLLVVLFEFRISPELIYQGRETDFPPGSTAPGPVTRYWALQQVYFGAEIVKLLCGGILGSYLFVFRASRRYKEPLVSTVERRRLTRS